MKIRLTKRQINNLIRESLKSLLLEELDVRVNDEIYKNLALQCERFGIKFSQAWLAAAAIAYGNRDYDKFMNYIIASTTAGGIDDMFMKKGGEEWVAETTPELRKEIIAQMKARIDLVSALIPSMQSVFSSKVSRFLSGEGDQVGPLDDAIIVSIDDYLERITPNRLEAFAGDIARFIRGGDSLSYEDSLSALTDRGNLDKILGKLVIITPPKKFDEMTPDEREAFTNVEARKLNVYGGDDVTKPITADILKQWSRVPEAEIIATLTAETSQPLGLAYVLPTVLEDFETLSLQNSEVPKWNDQLIETIAWPGPFKKLSPVKWSDLLVESPGEEVKFSNKWKFTSKLTESALETLRDELDVALLSLAGQPDNEQFKKTRFVILDLRSSLPPNKVYTFEGRESAAKFECPAETTAEMLELAFTDISEDINVACKLAVADSFVVNGAVALLQIAQMAIPKIIGGMLASQAAAIGAVATPEMLGAGAIPAGVAAYIEGEAAGRIINAFLVIIENTLTQIYPLLYGTVYFARKKKLDIAGILLTRAVVQIGFTILQACTAELGAAAKRFGYPKLIEQISKMPGWTEILVIISGIIIDMWLSIEQKDMLLPGSKEVLMSQVRKFVSPYKDDSFSDDTLKKMKSSIDSQRVSDLLGIENLFLAFEQLRYTEKSKN